MARTRLQKATTDYFSKLPAEVLRFIFAYFCPHCCNEYQWPFGAPPDSKRAENRTTLYDLCLVSRRFHPFAQEVLHHSFDPYYPYTKWDAPNPWERRLEPFLQTIASRPDLALSVKTVFLKKRLLEQLDFDRSRKAFYACSRVFGVSAIEFFDSYRNNLTIAIKRSFFRGIRPPVSMMRDDFVPIVAGQLLSILVAILPNLGHISLEKDFRWRFDVSPTTLDKLGVSSIALKTLETDHNVPNLFARAPELETLVTSGSERFPSMPSIRNLHIGSRHAVNASNIEHLISACTGTLSAFSYTSYDSDVLSVLNFLDKPRFHASLETLHLNMRRRDHRSDHNMPSLKQFAHLKKLFLPTYFLYGWKYFACCGGKCNFKSLADTLPSSIMSLDLSEQTLTPNGRMHDDLLSLSKDVAFAFPHLREIRSNAGLIRDEYPKALFKSVGIDLIHQDPSICCWIDTALTTLLNSVNYSHNLFWDVARYGDTL
ncbi:hypothetical protein BFJ72_g13329 [Fusarium proliferatum]|uniref:F-box domain-containing protein n=1 Tax=Gibberella intermedia TaxID=948311 RepID=A0A420SCV0_GIBIN|nr:hypothetical protein BFJ72_g13329 [Fusarium proliferatum]